MPPLVFHKRTVSSEIHSNIASIIRAFWDHFRRNTHTDPTIHGYLEHTTEISHKALSLHSFHNPFFIIIGLSVLSIHSLKKAIISLRIEQSLLINARFLKLMIHIRCYDKIILILYQIK